MGLTVLINGIVEFQGKRKANGWLLVLVSLFVIYVSIQELIIS
ncbi:YczI family protein [Priestia filamentosa]